VCTMCYTTLSRFRGAGSPKGTRTLVLSCRWARVACTCVYAGVNAAQIKCGWRPFLSFLTSLRRRDARRHDYINDRPSRPVNLSFFESERKRENENAIIGDEWESSFLWLRLRLCRLDTEFSRSQIPVARLAARGDSQIRRN